MSLTDTDYQRLARHRAGEESPEERAATALWIAVDSERQGVLAAWDQWVAGVRPPAVWNHETAWHRLAASMHEAPQPRSGPAHRRWLPATLAGATIAAVALLGISVVVVAHARRSSNLESSLGRPVQQYTTTSGQRATVDLLDGTRVMLNVGSRLEVPATFGHNTRTVRLTGNALFTVTHTNSTPFVVDAGATHTTVLGTEFSLRHYATDSTTVIAVRSGKVAIRRDMNTEGTSTSAYVVSAGRQLLVPSQGTMIDAPATQGSYSFATGWIEFANTPLQQAIPDLNRWYNADVRIGDATMAQRSVIGSFPSGSSADLARLLTTIFNARVVQQGNTLTLYTK